MAPLAFILPVPDFRILPALAFGALRILPALAFGALRILPALAFGALLVSARAANAFRRHG